MKIRIKIPVPKLIALTVLFTVIFAIIWILTGFVGETLMMIWFGIGGIGLVIWFFHVISKIMEFNMEYYGDSWPTPRQQLGLEKKKR